MFWVEVGGVVTSVWWVFLSWRWYFNEVRVSGGGFSFVGTLGLGTVEWQRIHVGELKAELRRTEDCTVEVL